MAQQLKRWESPRRKGRNHKGRGGSAKQRQYMKRQKQLRKKLQAGINQDDNVNDQGGRPNKLNIINEKRESHFDGDSLFFT